MFNLSPEYWIEKSKESPTALLLVISVVVFFASLLLGKYGVINSWGLVPSSISFSDPISLLPFLTSIFLHGGVIHILFNLYYLNIFGKIVERALSYQAFVLFYLGGGVAANLLQFAIAPHSAIPIVGASGAISALLGFYMILAGDSAQAKSFRTSIIFWFAIQLLAGLGSMSSDLGGIAWWAHIGGFLFGVASAYIYDFINERRSY